MTECLLFIKMNCRLRDKPVILSLAVVSFLACIYMYTYITSYNSISATVFLNPETKQLLDPNPLSSHKFIRKYPEIQKRGVNKKCLVGVASSIPLLSTLSKAALETWVDSISNICDVRFFVGQGELNEEHKIFGDMIVQLDVSDDNYPPIDKMFGLWSYMHSQVHLYDWFCKIDGDTYVNADRFVSLLNRTGNSGSGYVGNPGEGNKEQRKNLGLSHSYCLGFGYLMGAHTLKLIGPNLEECASNNVILHDDIELGRCVFQHDNMECMLPPVPFTHLFYQTVEGYIVPSKLSSNKAKNEDEITYEPTQNVFPSTPNEILYSSALVHPLKKPEYFYKFHKQIIGFIRPNIPDYFSERNCKDIHTELCEETILSYSRTCVNNPSTQLELNNFYLPECPTPSVEEIININNIPVYVLSLDNENARLQFDILKLLLEPHGLTDVRRFIATDGRKAFDNLTLGTKLKVGELGYIDTMRRIFQEARKLRLPRIMVLDDDAMPHKEFGTKLKKIMEEGRCGSHLYTKNKGGILMLGCSIWSNGSYPKFIKNWVGGWNLADADRFNQTTNGPSSKCFNVNSRVVGSFAAIYHQSTFDAIISWLDEDKGQTPFDWIFSQLSIKGYIVRTAYPNLMVANIDHVSTTDPLRLGRVTVEETAAVHRWNFSQYCSNPANC